MAAPAARRPNATRWLMRRPGMSRRKLLQASASAFMALLARPGGAGAQQDLLQRGVEGLGGMLGGGGGESALSEVQIGRGLKEALRVASRTVVNRVGQAGGYLEDEAIRIPLPGYLETARSVLGAVGAADLLQDLEVRLNRAAEAAAPHAESIFLDAIGEMTVADARDILAGPDDAATRYFQRTMTPELKATFRPIIQGELNQTGAIGTFDRVVARYQAVPFASALGEDAKGRLVGHALEGALNGIFHYLAREEAAIRNDPVKRTTDLLRQVFG